MNFQAYLEDTYRIIKEEPVTLILGGLIVQILTMLSLGIMAGPFLGGYFLLIIYFLRDNKKPSFNDIFSGLQQFRNLFPFFLVLLTIFIGFMLLIIPGIIMSTWWIYVLPLMVDRKIGFGEAMKLSTNKVNSNGFFMHLVFLLLISVIPIMLLNFLSAMIPFLFVLKILLPPFQAGCLASLYIDQFGKQDPATEVTETPEPVPDTTEATADLVESTSEPAGEGEKPAADEAGTNTDSHIERLAPSEQEGEEKQEKY